MKNKSSHFPGARFYKADLHIHTPASKCWEGKRNDDTLEKIFEKLKKKRIEVIAITDHNTGKNIDAAKIIGKKYDVCVFPGVEVSTKEGHVLAIFDPQSKSADINNWLAKMGIVGSKLGNDKTMAEEQDGSPLSISKVFSLIERNNGIAIAPHPNSKNVGFLEVMKQKGLARQAAYNSHDLRGLEVGLNEAKILELASGKINGFEKRYGCVASSDAHSLQRIGDTFTYIKLGDFSIDALRQVFYDPAMRIRFSNEWPLEEHIWIESLEVDKGFFDGISFRFHPDMNCLVGGKAVGKSLMIELMRFALGLESPIHAVNDNCNDMMLAQTCFGAGGTVTLHIRGKDGQLYRIQRTLSELDEGPEIYYESTPTKAGENVSEFFECQIYSQNEIIELGKSITALLDWLDSFIDLSSERHEISVHKARVLKLLRQLDEKHELAIKVPNLGKRKGDLEAKKKLLEEKVQEPILKSFPAWQQEERQLKKMLSGLSELEGDVINELKEIRVKDYLPRLKKNSPNYKDIESQNKSLIEFSDNISEAASKLGKALATKQKQLTVFISKWRKKFEKAEGKYIDVIKSAGVKNAASITSELNKVTQAIENVESKLKKSKDAAQQKQSLEITLLNTLIPEYSGMYKTIYEKRAKKAKNISNSLNNFVKIRVFPMNDRSSFKKIIEKLAQKSGLRKDQCQIISNCVTPIELAVCVLEKNAKKLSKKTGLKEEKLEVFIETVWSKTEDEDGHERPSKIYALMLTELHDTITVELQVEPNVYKPMSELSGGSKCTAILSVALIEGSCPLIVDQPEDALDNPFVFERIVQTVRRTKTGRQYIFATHNPNVAVASDADLIYCLKASANQGDVDKRGSIDEVSTRDRVVTNLEGGHKAFRLRTQKYDISVDDPNAVVLDIFST